MNNSLPHIVKNNKLIYKLRILFLKIFGDKIHNKKEKKSKNVSISKDINIGFIDNIKAEGNNNVIALQHKINKNYIKLIDISDSELCDLIGIYQKKIKDKRDKNQFNNDIRVKGIIENNRLKKLKSKLENNELNENSISIDDKNKIIDLYAKEIILLSKKITLKTETTLKLKKVLERKGV